MNIKIETLPKYRLACVRQVGPYGPANIQAMEKLKKWARETNLLNQTAIIFGIPQDNPETTSPDNCRYDACIVLSGNDQMDDSMRETELYGGKYAIFKIKHTAEDIRKAWGEIFPSLHNNGYQIDHKPILERYSADMLSNDYCEICVPIKPLLFD